MRKRVPAERMNELKHVPAKLGESKLGSTATTRRVKQLHCRRGASAIFEVRAPSTLSFFGDFWGPESASKRGLAQDGLKSAPWAPWGRPGRVQGRKWFPAGSPKETPGEPKRLQNRVKIEVFFPMPRGRFQDLPPGAPRGAFWSHFGCFVVVFWRFPMCFLQCIFETLRFLMCLLRFGFPLFM